MLPLVRGQADGLAVLVADAAVLQPAVAVLQPAVAVLQPAVASQPAVGAADGRVPVGFLGRAGERACLRMYQCVSAS